MLRIEKVFLQGFKSFSDPTEIVFDAEGITAVVGPNGCGKSNVADALSWVIGEQRAKALRGGKMEDVIFQGSRNRKPSGLAEVLLTMRVAEAFEIRAKEDIALDPVTTDNFTNESVGEIIAGPVVAGPIPNLSRPKPAASARHYQPDERITIARRLYRTGESEYEMNGRSCRLRDVQDLFAGTGLGGAHYAIIEQGRIGQVLSAKPLDRRALIEEAAGISKFKLRQRTAELKLEAAQQNLSRLNDIIVEVERHQGTLNRQAAKARRYQRLRNDMRELMQAVFVTDFRAMQQSFTEIDLKKQEIAHQESDISRQIAQTEATRHITLDQINRLDLNLTQARAETAQTKLQFEKTYQQQSHLKEKINALTTRTQQVTQDQMAISERGQFTTLEIKNLREKLQLTEQEINAEASSLAQAEKTHLVESTHDEQAEKNLELAQWQVTETSTQRERWKHLVRQFADTVERCRRTLAGLAAERQRSLEQAQKIASNLAETVNQIALSEQRQDQTLIQLATIKQLLLLKQEEAQKIATDLRQVQQQQSITEQRLKSLQELDERRAYFSPPVQAIMQESRKSQTERDFHIIGTLSDFIKVNPKDEVLIELGLKEELQYLIAPGFDDALRAIEFLKRKQLGRATFLILQGKSGGNESPVEINRPSQIVRLIDLLVINPELCSIIRQALPKLAQTVLADEVQQAISDSINSNGKGQSFLTTTGEFISAGHLITGGSLTEAGVGVLALKREIEQLESELVSLAEQISAMTEQDSSHKLELLQIHTQNSALDIQSRETEKELLLLRGTQQQNEREQERTTVHLRVIEKEIAQAEMEQSEWAEKLLHAEVELDQAEELLLSAQALAATAQASGVEIRRQANERTQELSRRRADFAAKAERRKGLQNDIKRLETAAQDITNRLSRLQMEALEAEQQTQSLHNLLLTIEQELESLQTLQQDQNGQTTALSAELTQEREQLLILEQELDQLRTTFSELRELRATTDITRTKLITSLEYLAATCQAELGTDIQTLLNQSLSSPLSEAPSLAGPAEEVEVEVEVEDDDPKLPADFDLETGKTRLQELRSKIEGLGPVNFLALDELRELEQRLVFLLEQKADITQAVSDTLSAIAEIKRRSRERFVTAFHHINQNFSEMFLELFGGGQAEMRLIDESDVLESGIDIIAQPPGKRLQNVLLLSGGEKAMAALALVLGIFKFRPSPFCLLDEVDAPLDDVNIGRFSDKILELSQHTQFMVITHSKRTMEAAKTLYGVTMEDPGVSKLISVRLT